MVGIPNYGGPGKNKWPERERLWITACMLLYKHIYEEVGCCTGGLLFRKRSSGKTVKVTFPAAATTTEKRSKKGGCKQAFLSHSHQVLAALGRPLRSQDHC